MTAGIRRSLDFETGDINWDEIFGKQGARWLHTGGIFCALSDTTPEVALEALKAAKRHGTVVSYDLNYRASLCGMLIGGKKRAQDVNRLIAPFVDVMLGNEEDFSAALGYQVPGMDEHMSKFGIDGFKQMIAKVVKDYPFQVVATTLRKAKTATVNDWGAICYCDGQLIRPKSAKILKFSTASGEAILLPRALSMVSSPAKIRSGQ